jgi:hypothetical protein
MKLRLLAAGRGGHAIVVVPGFLTEADELGRWVPALRSSGFGGDILMIAEVGDHKVTTKELL